MKTNYIYMDNFRGFTNTTIPLLDVNFLVGENSSGKTSVLKVISVIEKELFDSLSRSRHDVINFNNLNDCISPESSVKDKFTIGIVLNYEQLIVATRTFRIGYQPYFKLSRYLIDGVLKEVRDFSLDEFSIKSVLEVNDNESFYLEPKYDPRQLVSYVLNKNIQGVEQILNLDPRAIQIFKRLDRVSSKMNIFFAPVRSAPKKTYDGSPDEGQETEAMLKFLIAKEKLDESSIKVFQEFGESSGLFKDVAIQNFGQGRYAINVTLNKKPIEISDVGYGVSQVLPLLSAIFQAKEGTSIFVQQPEVHLHPKAQAALGGLIHYFAYAKSLKFFIETHSEYLVDRYRYEMHSMAKSLTSIGSKAKTTTAQVLYFEKDGNKNVVHPLELNNNGKFVDTKSEGLRKYSDFLLNESMQMFEIE